MEKFVKKATYVTGFLILFTMAYAIISGKDIAYSSGLQNPYGNAVYATTSNGVYMLTDSIDAYEAQTGRVIPANYAN